jgi:ribonuclease III
MTLDPPRKAELVQLARGLGIDFVDLDVLHQALLHSSYINECDMPHFEGNERLEFLGDAVLGLIVTEELFRRYQDKREGDLSKIKSVVVSRRVLAEKARQLQLGNSIRLGRGEELTGGRNRRSILANTFESLIGAIFISGGTHFAREFILRHLNRDIEQAVTGESFTDHKSELQEVAQRFWGKLPVYRVIGIEGPDHDKIYRVEVQLNDSVLGVGQGKSKKSAQQAAACQALEKMNGQEA